MRAPQGAPVPHPTGSREGDDHRGSQQGLAHAFGQVWVASTGLWDLGPAGIPPVEGLCLRPCACRPAGPSFCKGRAGGAVSQWVSR